MSPSLHSCTSGLTNWDLKRNNSAPFTSHTNRKRKQWRSLTNFWKHLLQPGGSILGLYRPLVASPKRTWPGLSSSEVRGPWPWGPGCAPRRSGASPAVSRGGGWKNSKRGGEGKGASGNPAGKNHSNERTLDLNNNKKAKILKQLFGVTDGKLRPRDELWLARGLWLPLTNLRPPPPTPSAQLHCTFWDDGLWGSQPPEKKELASFGWRGQEGAAAGAGGAGGRSRASVPRVTAWDGVLRLSGHLGPAWERAAALNPEAARGRRASQTQSRPCGRRCDFRDGGAGLIDWFAPLNPRCVAGGGRSSCGRGPRVAAGGSLRPCVPAPPRPAPEGPPGPAAGGWFTAAPDRLGRNHFDRETDSPGSARKRPERGEAWGRGRRGQGRRRASTPRAGRPSGRGGRGRSRLLPTFWRGTELPGVRGDPSLPAPGTSACAPAARSPGLFHAARPSPRAQQSHCAGTPHSQLWARFHWKAGAGGEQKRLRDQEEKPLAPWGPGRSLEEPPRPHLCPFKHSSLPFFAAQKTNSRAARLCLENLTFFFKSPKTLGCCVLCFSSWLFLLPKRNNRSLKFLRNL